MEISWITVSAQIVNFLFLIWLLKRFLYQPVIQAMDRREAHIRQRLGSAEERERQAESVAADYRQQAEGLERQRDEVLGQASEEAAARKRKMLDEARAEVAAARERWLDQLADEKAEFQSVLRRRSIAAIHAIARKALADLADETLEQRIIRKFITKLHHLDGPTRQALSDGEQPLHIVTAFALDSDMQDRLAAAVHDQLAPGLELEYEESDELLCGIELTSAGRRLSFAMDHYLEELAVRVDEALEPASGAGAA